MSVWKEKPGASIRQPCVADTGVAPTLNTWPGAPALVSTVQCTCGPAVMSRPCGGRSESTVAGASLRGEEGGGRGGAGNRFGHQLQGPEAWEELRRAGDEMGEVVTAGRSCILQSQGQGEWRFSRVLGFLDPHACVWVRVGKKRNKTTGHTLMFIQNSLFDWDTAVQEWAGSGLRVCLLGDRAIHWPCREGGQADMTG